MSDPFRDQEFPKGALIAAAALIGFALLAAAGARFTGQGTTQTPSARAVEVRDLRFEDRADGAVAVYESAGGAPVAVFEPGTNGFLRSVMRGMARERRRQEIGAEPPFRLTRWSDGRLSLDDAATGRHIDLEAFGPDNSSVFARLMLADSGAR
jgi:putative photosynthetic complex assembly protein